MLDDKVAYVEYKSYKKSTNQTYGKISHDSEEISPTTSTKRLV
jgi:hypothetical protein